MICNNCGIEDKYNENQHCFFCELSDLYHKGKITKSEYERAKDKLIDYFTRRNGIIKKIEALERIETTDAAQILTLHAEIASLRAQLPSPPPPNGGGNQSDQQELLNKSKAEVKFYLWCCLGLLGGIFILMIVAYYYYTKSTKKHV